MYGRGDDPVGDPDRAQISQFELFELKFLNSSCTEGIRIPFGDHPLHLERDRED